MIKTSQLTVNFLINFFSRSIVCIGVSTPPPPQKHPPPLFLAKTPIEFANCLSPPFLDNPPYILIFHEPLLKIGFFSEPQKYKSLSFLIISHFLMVNKFLVKISQFEFLVMTERNIFAYKLFLSLNISDFCLFFM